VAAEPVRPDDCGVPRLPHPRGRCAARRPAAVAGAVRRAGQEHRRSPAARPGRRAGCEAREEDRHAQDQEEEVSDIDPARFAINTTTISGFTQAFVRENAGGGGPLVLGHGWPETKRIWWRVIEPLARAGFEVIVPDLRGFGDSDVAPDGFHDVASHARDVHALVHDHLGHDHAVLVGGDLGGPVIQDIALRFDGFATRMVLFNSPLPYDKERMAGLRTRPPREAGDYFVRQGTDPDG